MMRWFKQWRAKRALEKTLRPDPDYRARRLAQFDSKRKERYWRNVGPI